jgi:hypothetical protein
MANFAQENGIPTELAGLQNSYLSDNINGVNSRFGPAKSFQ